MITVGDAFEKFKSRFEATTTEEQNASARQQRIRGQLDASELEIRKDFLTGSYRRETKTKPLRDVDIFIVLSDLAYLSEHPVVVLSDVQKILEPHYPGRTEPDRFAVRVDFGVQLVDDTSGEVMSFDVVPAFDHEDGGYLIPDDFTGQWVRTDPTVHAAMATAANKVYDGRWKPLVKMVKKWNDHASKPIQPSFLIEVMALEILAGAWGGSYPRELRAFFAEATARIGEPWPDPARLGPNVSGQLEADPYQRSAAQAALRDAERACTHALRLEQQGRIGDALEAWQGLLGPAFAKS
ncbi:CBASS oligonucleotide cyclase [Microbispora sp. NBC_01389]|uniref:CBASS oligonucleotide cyclase n=1 Tax=Microbispora sp. NBC_01389 TaxID=2903584 RepID=UPI0032498DB2